MKAYFNKRFESDLKYVFEGEKETITIYLPPEPWSESPVRTRLGEIESPFLFLTALFICSLKQSTSDSKFESPIPKVYGILSGHDINYAPYVYLSAAVLWLQNDRELLEIFKENSSYFENEGFHINNDVYNHLKGMIDNKTGLFNNFTSTEIKYDLARLVLKKLIYTYNPTN